MSDVTTFKIIEKAMDLRGTKFLNFFFCYYKNKCFPNVIKKKGYPAGGSAAAAAAVAGAAGRAAGFLALIRRLRN